MTRKRKHSEAFFSKSGEPVLKKRKYNNDSPLGGQSITNEPESKKRLKRQCFIKNYFLQIIDSHRDELQRELEVMQGNDTDKKEEIMESYSWDLPHEDEKYAQVTLKEFINVEVDMSLKVKEAWTVDMLFNLAFGTHGNVNPYIEETFIDNHPAEVAKMIKLFLEDAKNDQDRARYDNYLARTKLVREQINEIRLEERQAQTKKL